MVKNCENWSIFSKRTKCKWKMAQII